jgi:putative MATE family efflux protein
MGVPMGVPMGVAMGANIIVAQYKGAGDEKSMQDSLNTTFVISMVMGLIITLLGVVFSKPILQLMSTPEDIIKDATVYLNIVFIGTIGNIIYNCLNGLIRGFGDTKWPFYTLLVASIFHIFLDLIFVLWFNWGVAGVAWSTIISQALSGILLWFRQATGVYGAKVNFKRGNKWIDSTIFKHIVRLGLPTSIQNVAMSFGSLIIQSFSNNFGSDFIAATTIITKADGFAIMPMMGLGMAITTFVGQNIGAGNIQRVNKGIKVATYMTLGIALVVGVVLRFCGGPILRAFGPDEAAFAMGLSGLRFHAFFYAFMGLQNLYTGALRGAGAAVSSAVTSVLAMLVRIPVAYFFAVLPLKKAINTAVSQGLYATYELAAAAGIGRENFMGIYYAMVASMICGTIFIFVFYQFTDWRSKGITNKARQMAPRH